MTAHIMKLQKKSFRFIWLKKQDIKGIGLYHLWLHTLKLKERAGAITI